MLCQCMTMGLEECGHTKATWKIREIRPLKSIRSITTKIKTREMVENMSSKISNVNRTIANGLLILSGSTSGSAGRWDSD